MNNYNELIQQLPSGKWFTAKEVNLAAATLNAMERRGLIVVNRNVHPMQYQKNAGLERHIKVINALNKCGEISDIAHLFIPEKSISILCQYKNDKGWCDYDDNPLTSDLTSQASVVYVCKQGKQVKTIEI